MTAVENLGNGTSFLLSVTGLIVDDWSGLLDVDVFRGANETLDGMPGEVESTDGLTVAAYDFSVPFNLKAASLPALYTAIGTIRALWTGPGLVLTRRRAKALTPFYEDHTCNAQYLGLSWPDADGRAMAALDIGGLLTFRNLDGSWS